MDFSSQVFILYCCKWRIFSIIFVHLGVSVVLDVRVPILFYFFLSGGLPAYVVVGALLTLMNVIVRPLLNLVTFPLKLLATILAIILVNGIFIWLTYQIVLLMDPNLVTLEIIGGLGGWIVVTLVIGIANWVMKFILK